MTHIIGFENYEIRINVNGNQAAVYNTDTKRYLKNTFSNQTSPSGFVRSYLIVNLRKDKKSHPHYIHRLVALYFIPNPLNYPTVDHINGNKLDNSINNLRWASYSQQSHNRSTLNNGTKLITGVTFSKQSKKYNSRINVDHKMIHLGSFNDIELAKQAYKDASALYYPNIKTFI